MTNPAARSSLTLTEPPPNQTMVLSALAAKRAELDALRMRLSEQMARLEQDLASIDGAMRLFVRPAESDDPLRQEAITGVLPTFRRGEIAEEAVSILRATSYPLCTQEIATAICVRRALSLEPAALLYLGQLIVANLRRAQKRGLVHEVGHTSRRAVLWFAPAPEPE